MSVTSDTAASGPAPALSLRREAEGAASALPPLLVAAEQLAATVQMGSHGRRRAGSGEEFWQYRPAHAGDELRFVDWRRSARSDSQYVRQREWQLAQSVHLWVDDAASMRFTGAESGRNARVTKSERARVLGLALAVLMVRGGERVGLTGPLAPPRPGRAQLMELAGLLSREAGVQDYGAPEIAGVTPQSRVVLLSDFFGDLGPIEAALGRLADRGVSGVMMQVLDPDEEAFPYDGRTIFQSMTGALVHETRKAGDLRARYLDRLAARRDQLATLARSAGWQFSTHHTGDPAQVALLWLYSALERGR
ncbi:MULTISPECIES: DUF58 domain-containing protein [unclassified Thioclava]|uniref:DUF58 domain-containing protein n=1 Tax=unclassified Thioclava TaxID=2621713 RepID=UPI001E454E86|nr:MULTISPECIES: DUF58 domain-containing protein [unclassified Thioclava]